MEVDQVCPGPRKEKQDDNSKTRQPSKTEQETECLQGELSQQTLDIRARYPGWG